jgi:hypothetical protein
MAQMKLHDINDLLQAKDYPCISIIVSTSRIDIRANRQALQRAATRASGLLNTIPCTMEQRTHLNKKINELVKEALPVMLDGVGIYISPQYAVTEVFPFPVRTKVVVNKNFELRDLRLKYAVSRYCSRLIPTYPVVNPGSIPLDCSPDRPGHKTSVSDPD